MKVLNNKDIRSSGAVKDLYICQDSLSLKKSIIDQIDNQIFYPVFNQVWSDVWQKSYSQLYHRVIHNRWEQYL